jgi:hypothetical protein
MAKAQNPTGVITKVDVEKAAVTLGATLSDPVAGRAVLAEVKNGLQTNQAVRERVMKDAYGDKLPVRLNTTAPPRPARPGEAAAPAAAPAVPGGRVAPDGKTYVPDPNRPGKYLMVQ